MLFYYFFFSRYINENGRETTTVLKYFGEDCYTVTTIKHPDGREERQESNSCSQLNDFGSSSVAIGNPGLGNSGFGNSGFGNSGLGNSQFPLSFN